VRGSFATPGPSFLRYGGNTTAIEVQAESGHRVLVDLGTGVTEFAKVLMAAEFGRGEGKLPILLTHTHVDHIQGLPFFTPFFVVGNSIRIMGCEPANVPLQQILQDQLNGHYSPLYGLENLAAGVEIKTLTPGSSWPVEGFEVEAAFMPHGGMRSLAYRISADDRTVVIMTDTEHGEDGPSDEAIELARDCDLLVHDAMFSDDEYPARRGWGHSSVSAAIGAAESFGAKRLALTHHNPDSEDDRIDAMVRDATGRSKVPLFAAREGDDIVL
jgi:phosphoribosyl 1,2-cyclic phosphodiesterase